MRVMQVAVAFVWLGACNTASRSDPVPVAPTSAAAVTPSPLPQPVETPPSPPPSAQASWDPPKKCAGWASKDRPRGSNCYGIMPAQCGADQASSYKGQSATPGIRARVEAFTPEGVRWIAPGEAVTDDLRVNRLNVHLDNRGVILDMDCY